MIFRCFAAGLCLLTASVANSADQEKDVDALLSKMRTAYSNVKTARVVVSTKSQRFGNQAVITDLSYMKERKISAKVSNLPSLKGKIWNFVSDGKKVAIDDLSGHVQLTEFDLDFIPMPINLEAMSFWDWKRQLSRGPGSNMEKSRFRLIKSESWNGKDWTVLEETAPVQNVYVRYFIDQKSSFIKRCQVYELDKRQLRQETIVTKFELNPTLKPSLFKVPLKATSTLKVTSRTDRRIEN